MKNRVNLWLVAIALLILPTQSAHAAFTGGWGCLGQFTFGANAGNPVNFVSTYVLQMQLNISSTNRVSGTMFFGNGEVCDFPVSGTISTGPSGIGSLTFSFTLTSTQKDEDNDLLCTALFAGKPGTVTAKFHTVTTAGGTRFSYFGKDDALTQSGVTDFDFNTFNGQCERQ